MTLFGAWAVYPALLAILSLGCGLLLERAAGVALRGALLIPAGLAAIVVVAQVPIVLGAPVLATPLILLLAAVGLALSPSRCLGLDRLAAGTAAAVFAVYAAPIVLTGEATFAGYVMLDDTSTWLAITDQVMERGRDISGLPLSSFEATLDVNLADGYPFGVFLPLGIGGKLLGIDVAWLFQPYMAFLALALALVFWSLAAEVTERRWLRVGTAFIAAQPALLFAYYLWGGVKEVAAALLLATAIALLGPVFDGRGGPRALIPTAIALAALVAVLTPAGIVWAVPALGIAAVLLWRLRGEGTALRDAGALVAATFVLSLPVLSTGKLLPAVNDPLTDPEELGNLVEPLPLSQIAGVWLAGDFRFDPTEPTITWILIFVVVSAAAFGLYELIRRRAVVPGLYAVGILIGTLGLIAFASPWNGAKAMAAGSSVVMFAAAMGVIGLHRSGRPRQAAALGALIAIGVLWSNVLAYREVRLAPREQLAELEEIGEDIAGQGPALMTEYQPYGVRHFLRDAAPEGASELRRRVVPTVDGGELEKGESGDTDQLALDGLLVYRTLVLRRSPSQSRPPLPYTLVRSGKYYEVWQRPPQLDGSLVEHLGLGTGLEVGEVPNCGTIEDLAERAQPGDELVAALAPPLLFFALGEASRPADWPADAGDARLVYPESDGELTLSTALPREGEYELWVGGTVSGRLTAIVNGEEVGSEQHLQNNEGQYIPLGTARMRAGENTIALRYEEPTLTPGSEGPSIAIGPLVLRPVGPPSPIETVPPERASELCGRRLDWVALVR